MKLNHVALSVNDSKEIENFYEDILGFNLQRKFLMATGITSRFFGINRDIDVYFMEKDGVGLEIFLYPEKDKKIFSHHCFDCLGSNIIYTKAQKKGYKTEVKINPGRNDTYFVWDKNGNMFELKEQINLFDRANWQEASEYGSGAKKKTLRDENGAKTILLRLPKNFHMDAHTHVTTEQHFIIKGKYISEGKTYKKGTYQIFQPRQDHGPFESKKGALVLVVWDPYQPQN